MRPIGEPPVKSDKHVIALGLDGNGAAPRRSCVPHTSELI